MSNFVSESLADLIAVRELQYTGSKIDDIKKYQKTISGGEIQFGRQSDADTLVLYKSDILAHSEEKALIEFVLTKTVCEGFFLGVIQTLYSQSCLFK